MATAPTIRNPERTAEHLLDVLVEIYHEYAEPGQTLEPQAAVWINVHPSVAAALYRRLTPELEDVLFVDQVCRVCGCTDEHGCDMGCHWVAADLCSSCREG